MRRHLASRGLVLLVLAVMGGVLPMRAGFAADNTTPYLPSPHLLYPVNVVLNNPNPPVFHWTGVPEAVSYTLQVASDPTFTTTVASTSTSNTRFTPTTEFGNGTYYWRLRVQGTNNQLSLYVNGSFAVNWRGAPQPISPKPGQTLNWGRDPFVFTWGSQAFAATYNIQISTTPTFVNAVFQQTTPNLSIVVPGSTLKNGVVYYWRVQAVDAANQVGYWSVPQTFVKQWRPTPAISYPDTLSARTSAEVFDPVLRWSRIDGAVKYEVQISTDVLLLSGNPGQTPPPSGIADDETTTLPYLVPKLGGLASANYIWHVRGIDDQGNAGPWSYWKPSVPGAYRFTVTPPPPVQPLSPPSGGTITVPRLRWAAVPYASTYEVQISTDANFSKSNTSVFPTYTNELAPGLWSPAPAINVLYYWRVRAVTGSGRVGKWSTDVTTVPWTFVFSSGGPVAAIEPLNGQSVQTPVFKWTRLPNADHYEVDIHDGVTNSFTTITTQNTTYTPTDATLLNDCSLVACFWYVRGVLSDGNREPTPDQATFGSFISAPLSSLPVYKVAVPTRPLPGDPPSPEMPSFCWRATQGAAKYQLFYSPGTDTFQPLSADQTAALCETPTSELPDGNYKWFVRALDQNGGIVGDGPISAFSIQSGVTTTGYGASCALFQSDYITPQTGKVNQYQPTFSWSPVPCAHGYHIYVATDPTFTNLVDEQVNYPYTVYLPKAPYYPTNATLYVLVRPILGTQGSGTSVELPPNVKSIYNGQRIALTAPTPALLSPANGAQLLDTPLLHWKRYLQAASYEVQVGTDPDLSGAPTLDATTFSSSYAPTADLPDGVWYWRIRGINSGNQKLTWSTIFRFTKRSPAPALYGPANNSQVTGMPVFTWQPVQRAAQYEIQVSNNDRSFLSALLDTGKVNVAAFVPKAIYPPSARFGNIYWRVRIIDSSGNAGPWSPGWRFALKFHYPILLTPLRNATLSTQYPVFAYQLLPGAASYQIEFSSVPDFSSVSQTIATQGTAWTPQSPQAPGTYYWRVRAVDGSGGVGLPSVARIFIQPVPPPPPTATPQPTATPPVTATPTPGKKKAAKVAITSASTIDAKGQPASAFAPGVKEVDYRFSWINAQPNVDTFQTVIYTSGGQEAGAGSVVKFPTVTGTANRVVFYYDVKTKARLAFPSGTYRLAIQLDGSPARSLSFTVK